VQSGFERFASVREGQVVAGKYRIERVLGAGGMGIVVAAHHLQLDAKVALKFLRPEALSNRETVARFAREARAAAKIKSEHVARVLDVGTLDDGAPYMVMEHLDGHDLAGWLREKGRLSVDLAVDFALQACEAVAEAHVLGIVHRDLKPSNLFIIRLPDGQLSVKVLDFGISKVPGGSATAGGAVTSTAATMGSPLYMSPEQMHSASSVDARADLWALGVVVYEMLAGVPPFAGESLPEVCAMILRSTPRRLEDLRSDLPHGLGSVVEKALQKDRDHRFRDVGELAARLAPFGSDGARVSARRIAGVFEMAEASVPGSGAAARAPAREYEATSAAPESTLAAPGLPLPLFVGTAHPVTRTSGAQGRATRPGRAFVWAGVAVVGLVGGVAAVYAHGLRRATEVPRVSTVAPPVPLPKSAVPAATAVAPAPLDEVPRGETPSVAAAPAAITASTERPRPRPRVEPRPKPPLNAAPSAAMPSGSAHTAPSAAAPNNCQLVSSFDSEGNQHFKQVCGN
jgi:tRNA A-37 threonylcarbamoyl transferase component Bud32